MNAPDELVIEDGVLKMKRAKSMPVREYLRCWQTDNGIPQGSSVCIVRREDLQGLYDAADLNTSA